MTKLIEKTYLSIADFIFEVRFTESDFLHSYYETKKNFFDFYKNFIIKKTKKKVDWIVEFKKLDKIFFYQRKLKKRKEYFLKLFKSQNKKSIVYYGLSLTQLELIIKQIIFDLLNNKNDFIIHSSSVLINNKAVIFTGPEGAGKSTISRFLSEKYSVLMDDESIIRELDKKFLLYQAPFTDKGINIIRKKDRREIKAVFFIKKAKICRIKKIDNKTQILKLFLENITLGKKALKKIISFVNTHNFYVFYFPKDQKKVLKEFEKSLKMGKL
ncbi:MAG: hypothetical protein KatS3mg093_451 [Candidatus Parcubacteria bacterium]|nr:MAG: hypothetical protein KatS3mg093_451 [Candidatus Parcubacteria bacterium]